MRMNKKRFIALLLVAVALLCQVTAGAVDLTKKGSIELTIQNGKGSPVNQVEVTLYQVGSVYTENNNLYFEALEGLGDVELNGLTAAKNQETAKALLEKVEDMDGIDSWEGKTGRDGAVFFGNLEMGVYLAAQTNYNVNYLDFEPFLVYLPATSADGSEWESEIQAVPKVEARPDEEPDPEPEPEPEPVPDPDIPLDPGDPGVLIPEPEVPTTLPQTGMLMWPIPLMAMAGLVLFAAGWSLDKKAKKQ